MEAVDPLRVILSFGLVLGLIGLFGFALKRFVNRNPNWLKQPQGRIKIVETRMLDARKKLVLIRLDDRDHLVLLSPQGDTLITSTQGLANE